MRINRRHIPFGNWLRNHKLGQHRIPWLKTHLRVVLLCVDMIVCRTAPAPSKVTDAIAYWGQSVPKLGLECRREFAYRVYVIKCAGTGPNSPYFYYVGITRSDNISKRMLEHFLDRKGSAFTVAHRPLSIELIYPAATAATEALVIQTLSYS